jgi:hypothetical protein
MLPERLADQLGGIPHAEFPHDVDAMFSYRPVAQAEQFTYLSARKTTNNMLEHLVFAASEARQSRR